MPSPKLTAVGSMPQSCPLRSGVAYWTVTTAPIWLTRTEPPNPPMLITPMSSTESTVASKVHVAMSAIAETLRTRWHVGAAEDPPLDDVLLQCFTYATTADPSNGLE